MLHDTEIPNNIVMSTNAFLVLTEIDDPRLTDDEKSELESFEYVTTQEEETDREHGTWFETIVVKNKINDALYGLTIERNIHIDIEEFSKDSIELSLMYPTTKIVYDYTEDFYATESIEAEV